MTRPQTTGELESLRALASGKLIVIPGWRYKLIVAIGTRLPLSWRLWMERQSPCRRSPS